MTGQGLAERGSLANKKPSPTGEGCVSQVGLRPEIDLQLGRGGPMRDQVMKMPPEVLLLLLVSRPLTARSMSSWISRSWLSVKPSAVPWL